MIGCFGSVSKIKCVSYIKEAKKRIRWLIHGEAGLLLSSLPSHLASPAAFSLLTGLWQANVLGLRWYQIDLRRCTAWLFGDQMKSGRDLGVPLNEAAAQIIASHKGKHKGFLFVNKRNKSIRGNF